jgi:sugar lactone lactonase YvrE
MYMSGTQNSKIYEYNLSTNYDISTASYLQDFSVSTQDSNPSGIAFNADGSKFFMAGYNTDFVYEYDLGTNYDITTAALSQSVNLSAFDTGLNGLRFNSDGTIMYTVGSQNDKVYQFTLSSGFDVSTVSFDQDFSVAAQTTNPTGLAFNATQTKMFVGFGGYVFEYNMDAPDTTGTVDFYLQVIS